MSVVRETSGNSTASRWPAALLLLVPMIAASQGAERLDCREIQLPPLSQQAADPACFVATDGAPFSYYRATLTNVPAGFSVMNGSYAAWCVDYAAPLRIEESLKAILYDSLAPVPPTLQSTNWDMVNYVINHRRGGAFDVQGAIWHFIGGPVPPSDPVFSPPSIETQLMIQDALANGEGFLPVGEGQVTAVILDAGTNIQTLVIEVAAPLNRPPIGNPDGLSTRRDVALLVDTAVLLANDIDPDGGEIALIEVSPASARGGTVALSGGNILYTPPAGFVGIDTFIYTITDGTCGNSTATVTVAVNPPPNQNPVANNDVASTLRDQGVVIPGANLLANDTDADGNPLVIIAVSSNSSAGGIVFLEGANVIYVPPAGFVGTDTFTYTVSDGQGGTATAIVTVNVIRPNAAPTPMNDTASTLRDQPAVIPGAQLLANDTDVDGDTLTIIAVSANSAAGGTVALVGTTVVYTPPAGFTGTDTFTYTVSDGQGGTATATVTVTVIRPNAAPIAVDDTASTLRNQPLIIPAAQLLANDSDPDGDLLTIVSVQTFTAQGGAAQLDGTNVLYFPPSGFTGADSFSYTVSDGRGGTATATVSLAVTRPNDAPVANNDNVATIRDQPVVIPVADLLVNDTDANGDTLTIIGVSTNSARGGVVVFDGTNVVYTPPPGFVGNDTFTYTVSDGNGGTATATVTVTVHPSNRPPMTGNFTAVTPQNTPLNIPLATLLSLASDPDGDAVQFDHVMSGTAAGGTATIVGTNIVFIPRTDFIGPDSFQFVVNDGRGLSATGTVMITVITAPMGVSEEAPVFNPQTGLFEQRVTVSNDGLVTLAAFQLCVSNLRTNIRVWNATGTTNGTNFVQYNRPLDPGQSVVIRVEYYVPDRRPFTPVFALKSAMPVSPASANGTDGVPIDRCFMDARIEGEPRFVIEFTSTPGRIYTVIYSDDMTSWKAATPSVTANANRTQWYDDGPPKTDIKPAAKGTRFYRVIEAP